MLIDTASISGKGGVTPIGRAFQKHNSGNRAGTFVGEVTGNPGKNTQQGLDYLNDILGNPNSTLVSKQHKQFGNIIDIRLPDGTGVRFTVDGQTFIGFLEKYTPKK